MPARAIRGKRTLLRTLCQRAERIQGGGLPWSKAVNASMLATHFSVGTLNLICVFCGDVDLPGLLPELEAAR